MITHRKVKLCFPNAVRHRCKGIRDLIVNLLMWVQSPQTSSSLPLLYLRACNEQKVKGALGFVQHILSLRFSLFSHMHHHHYLLLLTKSTKPRLPVFKVRVQLNFRNYLTFLSSLGSRLIQAKQKRWSVVLLTVGLLIFSFHGPRHVGFVSWFMWVCKLYYQTVQFSPSTVVGYNTARRQESWLVVLEKKIRSILLATTSPRIKLLAS